MTTVEELLAVRSLSDQLYAQGEAPAFAGDHPLAGLQVRISAAGHAFHGGHGAGVGKHGEVGGHLSAAAKAAHEETKRKEEENKKEFLAKHHAEQAGRHAGLSDDHARKALASDNPQEIHHHSTKAEEHLAAAKQHADEARKHAADSDHAFVAAHQASTAEAPAKNAAEHRRVAEHYAAEASARLAKDTADLRAAIEEYGGKVAPTQEKHAAAREATAKAESRLGAAQKRLESGKGTESAVEKARQNLAKAKREEENAEFVAGYVKNTVAQYQKTLDQAHETAAEHVELSVRGHRIVQSAGQDGVARGEHGVDFHVSEGVHPASYGNAARVIERMTAHDPALQASLRADKTTAFVYKSGSRFTDHEPFASLRGETSTNGVRYDTHAAGVANVQHNGRKYLAAPEERGHSHVLKHEAGHAIHFAAGQERVRGSESKAVLDRQIRANYKEAQKRGVFPSKYGSDNHYEHWAELTSAWHGGSLEGRDRAWVKANDPKSARLLTQVYGDG